MDIHPTAWIAPTALIDRTWPRGVHIGAHSHIAAEAVLLTHDLTRGIYVDTRIGKYCIIGARAIILPGVSIGNNSIIAPGAVVSHDIADNMRAAGNPARAEPR